MKNELNVEMIVLHKFQLFIDLCVCEKLNAIYMYVYERKRDSEKLHSGDERARIVSDESERIYERSIPGLHALRFVLRVRHSIWHSVKAMLTGLLMRWLKLGRECGN